MKVFVNVHHAKDQDRATEFCASIQNSNYELGKGSGYGSGDFIISWNRHIPSCEERNKKMEDLGGNVIVAENSSFNPFLPEKHISLFFSHHNSVHRFYDNNGHTYIDADWVEDNQNHGIVLAVMEEINKEKKIIQGTVGVSLQRGIAHPCVSPLHKLITKQAEQFSKSNNFKLIRFEHPRISPKKSMSAFDGITEYLFTSNSAAGLLALLRGAKVITNYKNYYLRQFCTLQAVENDEEPLETIHSPSFISAIKLYSCFSFNKQDFMSGRAINRVIDYFNRVTQ